MSFDRRKLAAIDGFLARKYVDTGRLPGTLTLVAHKNEVVHLGLTGFSDVERGKKLAEDTVFRIYSMTKPLTSVALMMCVERGLIALDDPVHRLIPEWKGLGVHVAGTHRTGFQTRPTDAPMRVIDLMRHTSGLTYGFQMRTDVDAAYRAAKVGEIEKAGTLESMVAALAKIPLEFSPGTAWNYSVSTDVLGLLIERATGTPFADFLAAELLGPLGMTDTGFHASHRSARRIASCYQPGPDGRIQLQDDAETSSFLAPPGFVSGGGGLVSTAADYLKFCQMLLAGGTLGGHRFIGRKTLALMTANHLPGGVDLPALSRSLFSEAAYSGVGFGLGFATTTNVATTLMPGSPGDYFWGGAASTFFWCDPAEDLAVIFMTQLIPSSTYPVRRELRTMVYAALD